MPNYILRNLPEELWDRVKHRAQRDGWPLRALFLQLLGDFADGRVTPTAGPPPAPIVMQKYLWLKQPFRRMVLQDPSILGLDVASQWGRLRDQIAAERPHGASQADLLDHVDRAERPAIVRWLEDSLSV